MDDVSEQREIAVSLLTRLNYRASAVSSGEAAIAYLQNHDVDLLVLDMIMDPGMDGLDTYRAICVSRPGQKAIIASGFAETERVRKALDLGAGPYVKKPYTIDKIGLAIRQALAGNR
jgi:two-component system cell cycle sensor histidine kinase/response regulator CckA